MPLDDFFNKIVFMQEFDIEKEAILIINKNHEVIEDLLRNQLQQGKDGDGNDVTIFGRGEYRDATIRHKLDEGEGLGAETEFITNYMTGAFYTSLKAVASGSSFETKSDVEYFEDIISQSGTKIMELDAESLQIFANEIMIPQIQEVFSIGFNGV